jgi:hypothetical protein
MDLTCAMDRRRFVRLLAVGAAAAAAAPLGAARAAAPGAAAEPGKGTSQHRPLTAAMKKEIETQKKSIADSLKILRTYELPAGSPPTTVFRAMRAARRER